MSNIFLAVQNKTSDTQILTELFVISLIWAFHKQIYDLTL
jgi:hypothetical protein